MKYDMCSTMSFDGIEYSAEHPLLEIISNMSERYLISFREKDVKIKKFRPVPVYCPVENSRPGWPVTVTGSISDL